MVVTAFFQRMVGAFAGMTFAYWIFVLSGAPQIAGEILTVVAGFAIWGVLHFVMFAPEQWEVTAQMLAPSLQSVAGWHMHHNFRNTSTEGLALSESVRANARDFAAAAGAGNEQDFRGVLGRGVDKVALRPVVAATMRMSGYRQVYADNHYVVFCRV